MLGRARNLFKGLGTPPETRVQYYTVVCPQGHRVRGQRHRGIPGGSAVPHAARESSCFPPARFPNRSRGPVRPGPAGGRDGGRRARRVEGSPRVQRRDMDELDDRSAEAEIVWDDEPAASPVAPAAAEARAEPAPARSPRTPPAAPTGRPPAPAAHPAPISPGSGPDDRTVSPPHRAPGGRAAREQAVPRAAAAREEVGKTRPWPDDLGPGQPPAPAPCPVRS